MARKAKVRSNVPGTLVPVPAGNFAEWLRNTSDALRSGKGGASVPCGTCRGCCRSSMFIHIGPEEKQTIKRIPRSLLFAAPGLPKGHLLMGYTDQGACPMLVDSRCSIYEHRPQTCRDYDCRVFAATGIAIDPHTQSEIANRVQAWQFEYPTEAAREQHHFVKQTAAFLEQHRDLFPSGTLPNYPVQLAAIAILVYRLFAGPTPRHATDEALAQAILTALNDPT